MGGDGSLTTGMQLMRNGLPVVGVPKTIDNDLAATAMTFGFDSAVSTVVDALDRLHTTADSHKRVMVVEVMGRNAGWIALWGGIAGGAHIILIPEIEFNFENVANAIRQREAQGLHSTMVVVAEGAHLPGGDAMTKEKSSSSEHRLGGIGDYVANKIAEMTGKETRSCTLGHLQRGGSPTALDRLLGARFGVKAQSFNGLYQSFAVSARIAQSRNLAIRYQLSGVPAMVVNGKYLVSGDSGRVVEVVKALIERERLAK